jgi:Domain of unknown function (DUF4252)
MKNTFLLLLIVLPMIAFSQSKSIEDFYSKFKNQEKITLLTISGGLIKFAASADENINKNVLDKISQIRLLVSEESFVTKNDYTKLKKNLKKDSFEDLMQINAEGAKVDILIRENGKYISEVVLLVNDDEDFIMISLEGNFQYSDLNDLNLNFDGGNYLKKLPKKRDLIPRA